MKKLEDVIRELKPTAIIGWPPLPLLGVGGWKGGTDKQMVLAVCLRCSSGRRSLHRADHQRYGVLQRASNHLCPQQPNQQG